MALVKLYSEVTRPKLDGNFKNVMEWHSLFEAMIDSNDALKPIKKLYFLKQAMIGDVKNLLHDYDLQSGTYKEAWEFVENRFYNKRAIYGDHFSDLVAPSFVA